MKKSIIALIVILVGCVCLGFSGYISNQVSQGQEKLSSAKSSLDSLGKISSLSPVTEGLDAQVNKKAEPKLKEGAEEIEKFTMIAQILRVVGILSLIAGGFIFFKTVKKTR